MNNTVYWVWLSLASGPASSLPRKLCKYFDSDIEAIYNADAQEYKRANATPKNIAALTDKSLETAESIIEWCKNKKVKVLTYSDKEYPARLKAITDWPCVLYYIGELYNIDNLLCLATVGTRRMTKYGHDTAYSLCYDLAKSGAVIVSGLAAGIDTATHRAALDAGGKTIAVIGTRIDKVYPAENREIMREIARKGLLITEYHPFYKTQSINFPQRNRLISGLSEATVVFEANRHSGSLITATYAQKQGKRVFALPGKIGEEGSLGTNDLIRDGCVLVTRAQDIIDEYKDIYSLKGDESMLYDYSPARKVKDSFGKAQAETIIPITNDLQKQIYSRLSIDKPISAEQLNIPGYGYGEVVSALTMLELAGYITAHPGNTYTKK